MKPKINIRKRIIISSIINAVVLFFVFSPLTSEIQKFMFGPDKVELVNAIQTKDTIAFEWSSVNDIKTYGIEINGDEEFFNTKNDNNFVLKKDENIDSYNVSILTRNIYGNVAKSTPIQFIYPLNESSKQFETRDQLSNTNLVTNFLLIRLPLPIISLLICSFWVLQFKLQNIRVFLLGIYPVSLLIPFILLLLSLVFDSNLKWGTSIFWAFIISIVYYLIIYFLLLTINILNNALQYVLPLAQAAKAAQFIFSLLAIYTLFILVYGANLFIFEKILLLLPFVFYLTFSSNMMIEHLNLQNVFIRSLSVTITMLFTIFVFALWPISSVYIILASAVIFYILLSVSLEFRESVHSFATIEYSLLIGLLAIIFILNSDWGTIGSII